MRPGLRRIGVPAGGSVFGDSGCNRFTGTYQVKGDRITIGPLASTEMACPEPQMSAEMTFLTRLQAAVTNRPTGGSRPTAPYAQ